MTGQAGGEDCDFTVEPLAIGIVIQHFPPKLGGAESQARILVSELVRRGHRVELITTRHSPELAPRTFEGLLTIRRLPTVAPRWLKLPVNLVSGFAGGLLQDEHRRAELSGRAEKFVRERFNSRRQSQKLIAQYQRLLYPRARPGGNAQRS